MFELLPASPMNAVLPVEIHQATYAIQGAAHSLPALIVGTDSTNSVDLGGDDLPPKR